MRYFRQPALAFWACFVLVAIVVTAVALSVHPKSAPSFGIHQAILPSQEKTIFSLEQQVAQLPDAAAAPTTLSTWASATVALADADASAYVHAGAVPGNPLLDAYRSLASAAAAVPGNADPAAAERVVGIVADQLETTSPTPAPALPHGA